MTFHRLLTFLPPKIPPEASPKWGGGFVSVRTVPRSILIIIYVYIYICVRACVCACVFFCPCVPAYKYTLYSITLHTFFIVCRHFSAQMGNFTSSSFTSA